MKGENVARYIQYRAGTATVSYIIIHTLLHSLPANACCVSNVTTSCKHSYIYTAYIQYDIGLSG